MMHTNKNADDHVLDQNVDQISREIAYVPFSGRIRSKCSSCMQKLLLLLLIFFLYEYKVCLPGGRRIWALAHAFRGPKVLDPGSYFFRDLGFLDLGSCF